MVASIPNDIFQFSTYSALAAGLEASPAGPQVAHLTNHGTYGIGTFGAPSGGGAMMMVDRVAWQTVPGSKSEWRRAPPDATMPFVQVTIFQPEYRAVVQRGGLSKEGVWGVLGEGGRAGGRNSFMPFRVRGAFREVSLRGGGAVQDVKGVVFGVAGPVWAAGVCEVGLQCCFMGDGAEGKKVGGRVEDFVAAAEGDVTVEWGVCGRFHLGLPRGEEWEALDLAA